MTTGWERISEDVLAHCHICGKACDTHVNCASDACHLLFIQCDDCRREMEGCCSEACRDYMRLPEEARKAMRKNIRKDASLHNKSKSRLQALRRK